jgi:hypothetical protein
MRSKDKHVLAHKLTAKAIRNGILKRQPCEVCGDPISEGHHDDYDKPLDIRWLCTKHHGEAHGKKGDEKRAETFARAVQELWGICPPDSSAPIATEKKVIYEGDKVYLTWTESIRLR